MTLLLDTVNQSRVTRWLWQNHQRAARTAVALYNYERANGCNLVLCVLSVCVKTGDKLSTSRSLAAQIAGCFLRAHCVQFIVDRLSALVAGVFRQLTGSDWDGLKSVGQKYEIRLISSFVTTAISRILRTVIVVEIEAAINCTGCSRKKLHKVYAPQFCNHTSQFSAKCSERNCLHEKGQCPNMAIKYSLFCSWQVKYLKTKLTAKSLRQICCVNKVRAKPTFQN